MRQTHVALALLLGSGLLAGCGGNSSTGVLPEDSGTSNYKDSGSDVHLVFRDSSTPHVDAVADTGMTPVADTSTPDTWVAPGPEAGTDSAMPPTGDASVDTSTPPVGDSSTPPDTSVPTHPDATADTAPPPTTDGGPYHADGSPPLDAPYYADAVPPTDAPYYADAVPPTDAPYYADGSPPIDAPYYADAVPPIDAPITVDSSPPPPVDSGPVATSSLVSVTLGGCPSTGYSAPVDVDGTTLQLIVDTGSTDLAVALNTCTTCNTAATFTPGSGVCGTTKTSSSFGDGSSWQGYICSSSVAVGSELPSVAIDYVGIYKQGGGFFQPYDCAGNNVGKDPLDGIIGFAPLTQDTIGSKANDAYFNELVADGVADNFSVVLCATGGGTMWFGGYDSNVAKPSLPLLYTPITQGGFWNVDLNGVSLTAGGTTTSVNISDSEATVDTGTEMFVIPSAGYNAIINALKNDSAITGAFGSAITASFFNNGTCVAPKNGMSRAQLDASLPAMSLTFPAVGGGTFEVRLPPTQSYLIPSTKTSGQYCGGIENGGPAGTGTVILGDAVMSSQLTVFDIGQNQIGFAPQGECN